MTEGSPTLLQRVRELLPANRVAALTGIVLSIIAFLTTLESSFVPGSPGAEAIGKGLVLLGTVLAVLRIVEKFLDGSQNWDSLLLSGQPKGNSGLVNANAAVVNDNDDIDPEEVAAGEAEAMKAAGLDKTPAPPEADVPKDGPTRGMPLGYDIQP